MNTYKKAWNDFTASHKALVVTGAVAQFALLGAALWDIAHRPAAQVRGPKSLWVGVSFVNILGPMAYFVVGRKRR